MPYPINLLEHHFRGSAREFIASNIESLKEMGYTKFLLEMNSEITPEICKQECLAALSIPGLPRSIYKATKALLELLRALEKNKISYAFIDPETRSEAQRINGLVSSVNRGIKARIDGAALC